MSGGKTRDVNPPTREVTGLLVAWSAGDESAFEKLVPLVHAELRRLAHREMSRERAGHTLQTTALVNEAYLRLIDVSQVKWQDRAHFFAMSARLMRRILVDHARHRNRLKHGGAMVRITLTDLNAKALSVGRDQDVLEVSELLDRLEKVDPRQAKLVELRFFGGLTLDEAAESLCISRRTVAYEWRMAQAWMRAELTK